MQGPALRRLLLPFSLTAAVLLADQISKTAVVRNLDLYEKVEVLGDFFWIWRSRNTAMAFSIGRGLPGSVKGILFVVLPAVALILLLIYYFKSRSLAGIQRWCFAAIFGGGLGNLIDRIFRQDGAVIDFISLKFYGIFGMERYPSFNVADSSVVIAAVILILFYLFCRRRS